MANIIYFLNKYKKTILILITVAFLIFVFSFYILSSICYFYSPFFWRDFLCPTEDAHEVILGTLISLCIFLILLFSIFCKSKLTNILLKGFACILLIIFVILRSTETLHLFFLSSHHETVPFPAPFLETFSPMYKITTIGVPVLFVLLLLTMLIVDIKEKLCKRNS